MCWIVVVCWDGKSVSGGEHGVLRWIGHLRRYINVGLRVASSVWGCRGRCSVVGKYERSERVFASKGNDVSEADAVEDDVFV
jgi:hypothetical protein